MLRQRSARQGDGAFVLEGATLLRSALDAGARVESVYVAADRSANGEAEEVVSRAFAAGARVFELADGVLERVADTVTPQPLLAVLPLPAEHASVPADATFVVVCVDVRDPGNTGAVIRAADAAGADAVVCCRGTADPFNPKTVRASAGSVLHLPLVVGPPADEALSELGKLGFRRLATTAHGGRPYTDVDLRQPVALVLGNEAAGLPGGLAQHVDESVTVPMSGQAESLNVALASAVVCFEVRRQRSPNLPAMEDRS